MPDDPGVPSTSLGIAVTTEVLRTDRLVLRPPRPDGVRRPGIPKLDGSREDAVVFVRMNGG